ncbi:MAG: hypothetical protein ACTSRP_03340 [Candidatus Helarchaeota archaeon]
MIFQNGYDWGQFIGDIVGGLMATIFAILTWYVIERIKKRQESNKIKEGYHKFYEKISKFDVTDKQKADLIKAEIIHLIVYDIGIKNLSKVLKFRYYKRNYDESYGHVYTLENSLWKLNIQSGIGKNAFNITRYDGLSYHFDDRPNQDVSVRNEFINYIKEECKKARIKL